MTNHIVVGRQLELNSGDFVKVLSVGKNKCEGGVAVEFPDGSVEIKHVTDFKKVVNSITREEFFNICRRYGITLNIHCLFTKLVNDGYIKEGG